MHKSTQALLHKGLSHLKVYFRNELLKRWVKLKSKPFLRTWLCKNRLRLPHNNQARSALLFLYREVLHLEMSGIDAVRAKRPQNVPTVLTKQEAISVIQQCDGIYQLVVKLLYGSGLRLIEGLRLQVNDSINGT